MKKILFSLFVIILLSLASYGWGKKKITTTLILSSVNPLIYDSFDEKIQTVRYFRKNSRIYFLIQNPNGFKSEYLRYQIVKQNENAHIGGYSRIKNQTVKVKDKYYFSDYFVLHQAGRYYLQVFDITDTNHWLNLEGFMVIDE